MKVIPAQMTNLIAATNGRIDVIRNSVLRKPATVAVQEEKLSDHSVCITCNYIFQDKVHQWSSKIDAICHPFRDDSIFPANKKKFLFSESDFCDSSVSPTNLKKQHQYYDFVYFTIDSLQGIECKGLYLLELIDLAATMAGMRGLVIDYGPPVQKIPVENKQSPEFVLKNVRKYSRQLKSLKWKHGLLSNQGVCDIMKSCGFVLFPNTKDASPRLITEAIIRDVPSLVNQNIYGGWKYINDQTGVFFDAPHISFLFNENWKDIRNKYAEQLSGKMKKMRDFNRSSISKNFYEQFGFENSAKKLASIINEISGTSYEYVCYKEFWPILTETVKAKE